MELPIFYVAEGTATSVALKAAASLQDSAAVVCIDAVAWHSPAEVRQVKAATLLLTPDLDQEFGLFDLYNQLPGKKKLVSAKAENSRRSSRALLICQWLRMHCKPRDII